MQIEVGAVLEGKVTGITKFGAFVELPGGKTGMVHISEVAHVYVKDIRDHVKENDTVKVKVLSIDENGKVSLSIKKATPPPRREPRQPAPRVTRPDSFEWTPRRNNSSNMSFEDMMAKFKQSSEEKISDLKRSSEFRKDGARRGGHSK